MSVERSGAGRGVGTDDVVTCVSASSLLRSSAAMGGQTEVDMTSHPLVPLTQKVFLGWNQYEKLPRTSEGGYQGHGDVPDVDAPRQLSKSLSRRRLAWGETLIFLQIHRPIWSEEDEGLTSAVAEPQMGLQHMQAVVDQEALVWLTVWGSRALGGFSSITSGTRDPCRSLSPVIANRSSSS